MRRTRPVRTELDVIIAAKHPELFTHKLAAPVTLKAQQVALQASGDQMTLAAHFQDEGLVFCRLIKSNPSL